MEEINEEDVELTYQLKLYHVFDKKFKGTYIEYQKPKPIKLKRVVEILIYSMRDWKRVNKLFIKRLYLFQLVFKELGETYTRKAVRRTYLYKGKYRKLFYRMCGLSDDLRDFYIKEKLLKEGILEKATLFGNDYYIFIFKYFLWKNKNYPVKYYSLNYYFQKHYRNERFCSDYKIYDYNKVPIPCVYCQKGDYCNDVCKYEGLLNVITIPNNIKLETLEKVIHLYNTSKMIFNFSV